MTPREVVKAAIEFGRPARLPRSFPEPYGSDFAHCSMRPHPDSRPGTGPDEWGAVWENIGVCKMGEVKHFPLTRWEDFDSLRIPDVSDPGRWEGIDQARQAAGDRYLLGSGISLYERVHFIRGLEDTWVDVYVNPDKLRQLIDVLVEMNLQAIRRYAEVDVDGFMFCDDWGLQDRLMISPDSWRQIWKPAYARVYEAAHQAGMHTLLHSCGYIVDILPDLIDIGLDVIQMDQQENMGLDVLSAYAGKITFWCPVDIQTVMCHGSNEEIRQYCRRLVHTLGTAEGGFIPKWYSDPAGAGHSQEAIDAMCAEFTAIQPGAAL